MVKLLLTGTGNFPFVTDPEISWPKGIEVSQPTVVDEVNKYKYPLSGTKTFEYTIQPHDTGNYIIPSVKIDYFNPATKRYASAETNPVNITVTPPVKNKNKEEQLIIKSSETPLHWYYFAAIAVVIFSIIAYQLFKFKANK